MIKDILRKTESVKGFLDPDEAMLLYEYAIKASKLGPLLEIGSYCGKSSSFLGHACLGSNSVVYSIDHHRGSEEQQKGQEYFDPELYNENENKVDTFPSFRKTIEQHNLGDVIIPIVSESHIVAKQWKTPLSLVFIDGSHTEANARIDYESWSPHIMPGGYLLIHDVFDSVESGGQAPRMVYNQALDSGGFVYEARVKSLVVLQTSSG